MTKELSATLALTVLAVTIWIIWIIFELIFTPTRPSFSGRGVQPLSPTLKIEALNSP